MGCIFFQISTKQMQINMVHNIEERTEREYSYFKAWNKDIEPTKSIPIMQEQD